MNIVYSIIANAAIVFAIIMGAVFGRRYGWKATLAKLICLAGIGVGAYFLNPILVNLACKIEVVNQIVNASALNLVLFKSIIFALVTIVAYIIAAVIISAIRKARCKNSIERSIGKNTAKRHKPVGLNKRDTKLLRQQQRAAYRNQKRELKATMKMQLHKSSIAGIFLGIVISIVVCFVVFMPIKHAVKLISETYHYSDIEYAYEYTPYGQLDKATNVVDFIIK